MGRSREGGPTWEGEKLIANLAGNIAACKKILINRPEGEKNGRQGGIFSKKKQQTPPKKTQHPNPNKKPNPHQQNPPKNNHPQL